mgnify:FL=1
MEIVNKLDIDGNRWEIEDSQARQEISVLKTNSDEKFKEIDTKLKEKADKNYVDNNFATLNEVVENQVTETSFINENNLIYKQGKICSASIVYLFLDRNYNKDDIVGVIENRDFFPRRFVRAPVVQLNTGLSAEIIIKENGEITVGQAGSLTAGYWIGNFSWVT